MIKNFEIHLHDRMIFWMFGLVCLARPCIGVFIDGLDCSLDCVCCKGGVGQCGFHPSSGDNYCFDGCIDGIYGHRCHNPCPGSCSSCAQSNGLPCHSCKATFYDTKSECSKSCSVGCNGGACNNDGTCSTCTENFEGTKCETCIQGKYGSSCTQYCSIQNCRCSTGTDCSSCKTGFYDRNNFCQTACSPGCQNAVCNDNGSCNCRAEFMGNKCSECQSGYYGAYCNVSCSAGCVNGLCLKDGTCLCHPNLVTEKCDKCLDGRYGVNCEEICSVGCTTTSCDKDNGLCECLLNFSGDKCDQCIAGFYEQLCDLPCSDNCKAHICSRYRGNCTHGCVDGYSGGNCTTPCDETCKTCQQHDKSHCVSCYNGYSGSTCRCPPNCKCDSASDVCTTCADGYANPKKQCKCQTQYCTGSVCDKCINQTYYVDNNACCECPENCKDSTCIGGPECISGCIDGFYGFDCSQRCLSLSADCLICNQTNGKCLECNDGFYPNGNGSCMSCSNNCKTGQCNTETGVCINGCTDRFWGDKCDTPCDPNCETCQLDSGICLSCKDTTHHGLTCSESCSTSCLESKCEQKTGYCSNGCSRDSFGSMCDIKCPENCQQGDLDTSCNIDGVCLYGCINDLGGRDCSERRIYIVSPTNVATAVLSGVLGILLICAAAGFYLWNRRRTTPTVSEQEDQRGTEMTYEQLQRQANEPTYKNVDENYSVLSL